MSLQKFARGTKGTPHQVITNSFEITKLPDKVFIQYQVSIQPDEEYLLTRQRIVERLQNHVQPGIFNPRCVWDGKAILYSSHELKLPGGSSGEFAVSLLDRPRSARASSMRGGEYTVKISRVAGEDINFRELDAFIKGQQKELTSRVITGINLLQFLVRQAPNMKYPNNARAFFTDAGKRDIGGGLELWRGYFQSVRPTIGRVLVNVDVSTSAMYLSGKLIDVALKVLRARTPRDLAFGANSPQQSKLKSFFKNVIVEFSHRKGQRKIQNIVPNAGNFRFDRETQDGNVSTMTVQEYMLDAYNIRLQYPDAFGIMFGKKGVKEIVVPAELCTVQTDQRYKRKLEPEHTKEMVSFSTQRPQERLEMIHGGGGRGGRGNNTPVLEYHNSPYILDAGMVIQPNPISITGRVLDTPSVRYGASEAKPQNGSWNIMRSKFIRAAPIARWAVVSFINQRGSEQMLESFVNTLVSCCRNLGMNLAAPKFQMGNGMDVAKSLETICAQVCPGQPPDLIIAILPSNAADIRFGIKQWGDVMRGVSTQCLREDKVKKAASNPNNTQYCNNVALKINAKLGGVNSMPDSPSLRKLAQAPYMIVGADVGHPGPGVTTQPSVASLVFSHDKYAVEYSTFISVQEPRTEKISDLMKLMVRAIKAFGNKNNMPPKSIIFFRDGLSEGEYAIVARQEIADIENAIQQLWQERNLTVSKPKITFIVVGKRHHIRFFPRQGAGDKSGNCPAGFVADYGIGNPVAPDFYIQSHGGLLGTSRPSHYVVLKDDNFQGNIDDLQELAFTLCHSYARATRSVSIPAPVYYADIICARAAFHFNPALRYDDAATVSSGSENSFNLDLWKKEFKEQHPNMEKKMFFM